MVVSVNSQYEAIFSPDNINQDCDGIAHEVDVVGETIKEKLRVGLYKQAVTMYLQLLKSMTKHFVEDEHWCYFDDWYSPDFSMKQIYDVIMKYDIDVEAAALLKAGHDEIQKTECYDNYGCPSYIR